jgi:hypothetical protein
VGGDGGIWAGPVRRDDVEGVDGWMTRGGERRWEARRGGEGEEERGVVGVVRGGGARAAAAGRRVISPPYLSSLRADECSLPLCFAVAVAVAVHTTRPSPPLLPPLAVAGIFACSGGALPPALARHVPPPRLFHGCFAFTSFECLGILGTDLTRPRGYGCDPKVCASVNYYFRTKFWSLIFKLQCGELT